jgi:hypothetical protein
VKRRFPLPLVPALPEGTSCYGLVARYDGPGELLHACEQVRDAGYRRWDAHTPFPVHGLDRAMGLRPSVLPWIVLVSGLGGAAAAFGLQTWVHGAAYPLVISGKPFFAWPAFVPVTFEVGVLFGALAAVLGMLGLNRLPMHHHPLFAAREFARATDDSFFISIEAWDPAFDLARTRGLLERSGAASVERVEA